MRVGFYLEEIPMGLLKKIVKKATKPVRKTHKAVRKVTKASNKVARKATKASNKATRKAIRGKSTTKGRGRSTTSKTMRKY